MIGQAVQIMNIIVGFALPEDEQPYASMAWKAAPVRSTIAAFTILNLQIFAFYTVKTASERKKTWEEYKRETHQLSMKDEDNDEQELVQV